MHLPPPHHLLARRSTTTVVSYQVFVGAAVLSVLLSIVPKSVRKAGQEVVQFDGRMLFVAVVVAMCNGP